MDPSHRPPADPVRSATVILARQTTAVIEVYLLRRNPASSAFPGFYVFPGGTLEPDDTDTDFWLGHVDRVTPSWRLALDGHPGQALPLAVAAIRETFEEAGLLLAAPATGGEAPQPLRRNGGSFKGQIARQNLMLSLSRLGRWSRWISPETMSKRFDTLFFVVPVDPDQECRPDLHETIHGMWIDPARALVENNEGRCPLSPPTLVTLHQLLEYHDLDLLSAEAQRRLWPDPRMPRMCPLDQGALIVEPWDPDYAEPTVAVEVDRLGSDVLPPHVPFSRLWLHQGCWRPVAHPHARGE